MADSEIQILLVEDSPTDAELTIHALKKGKIANRLIHLKDGAEALEYLFGIGKYLGREVTDKPQMILLDLHMPKVSGIELLEKIRSDESTRDIPVVVLTSSNEYLDIEKCYLMGANSYIVKPVEFGSFMRAVGELGFYCMLLREAPAQ